jgi:hypothetical protein
MWLMAIFKGQVSFRAIGIRLVLIVLGAAPVFIGGILSGFFPDGPMSLLGLAVILAVFALAGWASKLIASENDDEEEVFPLPLTILCYGKENFYGK